MLAHENILLRCFRAKLRLHRKFETGKLLHTARRCKVKLQLSYDSRQLQTTQTGTRTERNGHFKEACDEETCVYNVKQRGNVRRNKLEAREQSRLDWIARNSLQERTNTKIPSKAVIF